MDYFFFIFTQISKKLLVCFVLHGSENQISIPFQVERSQKTDSDNLTGMSATGKGSKNNNNKNLAAIEENLDHISTPLELLCLSSTHTQLIL